MWPVLIWLGPRFPGVLVPAKRVIASYYSQNVLTLKLVVIGGNSHVWRFSCLNSVGVIRSWRYFSALLALDCWQILYEIGHDMLWLHRLGSPPRVMHVLEVAGPNKQITGPGTLFLFRSKE